MLSRNWSCPVKNKKIQSVGTDEYCPYDIARTDNNSTIKYIGGEYMSDPEYNNKLIHEKSPYLLQHAHNPVNWYPWGEEAFDKAKREDKPIFLSIGYSTCHWCHVMAHESFEDEEVATALNRDFIAVKVDREERPDVDAVYMAVCQALTGSGGWPMTVLMTPEQKPFYAGTYLPKSSRYSMPGLLDILAAATDQWHNHRDELLESGDKITQAIQTGSNQNKNIRLNQDSVFAAYSLFSQSFDGRYGGFGSSPKFPTPHNLMFLLRYYKQESDVRALAMAEKTLQQMYRGGIFDHVGFGFSRYSTDERWLVPHFEKMLYDNALLTIAYLETYQITGVEFYKTAAVKILTYIQREMTDSGGCFYSAQDADSDGVEGKYYVFTPGEITALLGEDDGAYFNEYFGIAPGGNFDGKNVPNLIHNSKFSLANERIEKMLPTVYAYRLTRTRLHKDDKILTSWNALMIAAFAKAYRILGDNKYLEIAQKAMKSLLQNLSDGKGNLYVRCRGGEASGTGNVDDYAFTIWALLELYGAGFDAEYLEKALLFNEKLLTDFWDEENRGFYLTAQNAEQLIYHPKETYDGAIPSGNSVAGYCLVQLAKLTGSPKLEEAASRQLQFLAGAVQSYLAGYSFALMAQMLSLYPGREVVAVMENSTDLEELKLLLRKKFLPNTVVLVIDANSETKIHKLAEFTKEYGLKNRKSTYYVCHNNACSPPVNELAELEKSLS